MRNVRWLAVAVVVVACAGFVKPAAAGPEFQGARADGRAGLAMAVEPAGPDAVLVRASGHGLDVSKRVTGSGAFALTIGTDGDVIRLTGDRQGLVLERNGESVSVSLVRVTPTSFSRAAAMLGGSPALQLFRRAMGQMGDDAQRTTAGTALLIADVMLRTIQDDPGAVRRLRDAADGSPVLRAALAPRNCFDGYKTDLLGAWGEYESCFNDFAWWTGGRELCAFSYLIEAEGLWFSYLKCVGFSY